MPRKPRVQPDGPLAGHTKSGKKFTPALLSFPGVQVYDWTRSGMPDLLWPATVIADEGPSGLERFSRWQASARELLRSADPDAAVDLISGRLIDLERFAELAPSEVGAALIESVVSADLVSDNFLVALRQYESVPGSWLLLNPFVDRTSDVADDVALEWLGDVLMTVGALPGSEALLKFTGINADVLGGKFSASEEIVEVLRVYPGDDAGRGFAETLIRNSYSARMATEDHSHPELAELRSAWADTFWDQSWVLTPCRVFEEEDAESESHDELIAELMGDLDEALGAFLDVLYFDRSAQTYERTTFEVVSGLVNRAVRSARSGIRAPHQWNGEQGSHVTRVLAETKIVLKYMHSQGPESYALYKSYGQGKQKLTRINLERMMKDFPGDPPQLLVDAVAKMAASTGGEMGESFIEVDTSPSFSGVSMREMARVVDESELYTSVFQSSSAVIHGEWWTVQENSMQKCINGLHGLHEIPFTGYRIPDTPQLAIVWMRLAEELMADALDQLRLEWPSDPVENPGEEPPGTS